MSIEVKCPYCKAFVQNNLIRTAGDDTIGPEMLTCKSCEKVFVVEIEFVETAKVKTSKLRFLGAPRKSKQTPAA